MLLEDAELNQVQIDDFDEEAEEEEAATEEEELASRTRNSKDST
jgi:hypothetical protein